jgi:ketosteroid isomerase-like protein
MVERYMEGFRRSDHAQVLSCLTEDVQWEIPGVLSLRGREAFDQAIENDAFVGPPIISVTRLIEEHDVVVAEGAVRTRKTSGEFVHLRFCDVFEMRDGQIARLVSYLNEVRVEEPTGTE